MGCKEVISSEVFVAFILHVQFLVSTILSVLYAYSTQWNRILRNYCVRRLKPIYCLATSYSCMSHCLIIVVLANLTLTFKSRRYVVSLRYSELTFCRMTQWGWEIQPRWSTHSIVSFFRLTTWRCETGTTSHSHLSSQIPMSEFPTTHQFPISEFPMTQVSWSGHRTGSGIRRTSLCWFTR